MVAKIYLQLLLLIVSLSISFDLSIKTMEAIRISDEAKALLDRETEKTKVPIIHIASEIIIKALSQPKPEST